ncbi:MAG: hypothetical protein IJT97_02840 [Bacteroidaceae bacterium]|nr:hypothetical protein [Bacteroidaceae bacterium]
MKVHFSLKQLAVPLLFAVIAYAVLLLNADYLYALQDNSVFINGRTFMRETMMYPNGLWAWMGCWLTQFFYHPWLGALIMVALWVLTYYFLIGATEAQSRWCIFAVLPQTFLLYTLLCLGYWMFYCKSPGIAFVPTLVLLTASALTCIVVRLIKFFVHRSFRKISYMVLILLYITLCPSLTTYSLRLPDTRLKSELRMYRAIDEGRWKDVLSDFHTTDKPTNLMVLYKNIALMHTGRLQEMFKQGNCGYQPTLPASVFGEDTLSVHISQLAAPMVYFQYGQQNYAYRWAIENSVEYGLSVRNLKMMIRCAIMNQELDVAYKYITLLKSTLFHRDWAIAHERMLSNSTDFLQDTEVQNIAPLLNEDDNALDTDDGLCEKWLLEHFSDLVTPASQKLEDVIITTSLWTEDDFSFAIHFYNYVNRHPKEPIPELYQEGAILICTQENSPVSLNQFPFDPIVAEKYNNFVRDYNQLSQQRLELPEMAARLRPLYGDTYWWYYYFYTDFEIY